MANGIFPTRSEWKLVIRFAVAILVVAYFVVNGIALLTGIVPFALAFVLSLALDPLVSRLGQTLRIGRGWGTLLTLLLLLGIGGLLVTWATTAVVGQVDAFIASLPQYLSTLVSFVNDLARRLVQMSNILPRSVIEFITENTSQIGQTAEQLLTGAGLAAIALLKGLPGLLTLGLLVPLATFFISKDLPVIKRFLWSLIPENGKRIVGSVIGDLWRVAWRYLRAQAILIMITTTLTTIGLLIVGVDHWLSAGLLIGILDVLPVIGPIAAFLPWAVYLLIVGNTSLAIAIMIVYAVAAGGRALIEAKVIGDSVGLHPVATLMAMYIGALLWGVIGIVVGPILVILVKAAYKAWQAVSPPHTPS